jgi:hypothetical protein
LLTIILVAAAVEAYAENMFNGSNPMNRTIAAVLLLSGLLAGCVQPPAPAATAPPAPTPAPAPPPAAAEPPVARVVSIQGAPCSRFLELANEDREAATMFYIGWQASRFRAQIINVGAIPTIAERSMNYCLDHPDRPVARAFASGYGSYLRSRRGG